MVSVKLHGPCPTYHVESTILTFQSPPLSLDASVEEILLTLARANRYHRSSLWWEHARSNPANESQPSRSYPKKYDRIVPLKIIISALKVANGSAVIAANLLYSWRPPPSQLPSTLAP
uniref:Uncharacterized protein n=1 Tax=Salix viminalis TaxID=40686 RepID=A0A6N2KZB1_SALVM